MIIYLHVDSGSLDFREQSRGNVCILQWQCPKYDYQDLTCGLSRSIGISEINNNNPQ